jgi:hypothetical protein
MREIHAGNTRPDVIGMRHDIDDNRDSFATAMALNRWEALHGYRSTFYVLHTASYWVDGPFFRAGLEEIALAGHEVGIHANAVAAALLTGDDPDEILWTAIDTLRDWGHTITGVAGHGDELCARVMFVNDEQFVECARPLYGAPDRTLVFKQVRVQLQPRPLDDFGLAYCAPWLSRSIYLTDSGDQWHPDFATVASDFATGGQLHVLQHPDWWPNAFALTHAEVTG